MNILFQHKNLVLSVEDGKMYELPNGDYIFSNGSDYSFTQNSDTKYIKLETLVENTENKVNE